jgi:hypothetical protein
LLGSRGAVGGTPRPLRVILAASRGRCDPPRQKREGFRSADRALARIVHFVAIQTDPRYGESHNEIIGTLSTERVTEGFDVRDAVAARALLETLF